MKVSKDKKYKTLGGYEFKIYEIYDDKVHGAYKDPYGVWVIISIDHDCLIEISPYADFKIDDKVLVWDDEYRKLKGHFAGIDKDNRPLTWLDGQTSFTTDYKKTWLHCIKYEENND